MATIKLVGPWIIANNCVERYYAVYYYSCHDLWIMEESGWQRLFGPSEIRTYHYDPFNKGSLIKKTKKGLEFRFQNYDEYITSCTLWETTQDNWPSPNWAIACELAEPSDWLKD